MTDLKTAALVDRLGLLYARKAELAAEEKALKEAICPEGAFAIPMTYKGNLFEVTVSRTAGRATLSMAAAKLYLTEALLAKITTMSASSTRWGVKARSAEKVAA